MLTELVYKERSIIQFFIMHKTLTLSNSSNEIIVILIPPSKYIKLIKSKLIKFTTKGLIENFYSKIQKSNMLLICFKPKLKNFYTPQFWTFSSIGEITNSYMNLKKTNI